MVLSPGNYNLNAPIKVTNPNTVVLGLGMATLISASGNAVLTIDGVDGVRVAGLLL